MNSYTVVYVRRLFSRNEETNHFLKGSDHCQWLSSRVGRCNSSLHLFRVHKAIQTLISRIPMDSRLQTIAFVSRMLWMVSQTVLFLSQARRVYRRIDLTFISASSCLALLRTFRRTVAKVLPLVHQRHKARCSRLPQLAKKAFPLLSVSERPFLIFSIHKAKTHPILCFQGYHCRIYRWRNLVSALACAISIATPTLCFRRRLHFFLGCLWRQRTIFTALIAP